MWYERIAEESRANPDNVMAREFDLRVFQYPGRESFEKFAALK